MIPWKAMIPRYSKLSSFLASIRPLQEGTPGGSLRITNVTRKTQIADCVDIAGRGRKRRKGLLGRSALSSGEGLWIVPCEAVHTFGMQFAIDLVYLDRSSRVVKTRSHVRPGRLSACLAAHSVVELPSGTVRASLTERGDKLELRRL